MINKDWPTRRNPFFSFCGKNITPEIFLGEAKTLCEAKTREYGKKTTKNVLANFDKTNGRYGALEQLVASWSLEHVQPSW